MKGGDFCYRCAYVERNKDGTVAIQPYCYRKERGHSRITGEAIFPLAITRRTTWRIFGGCNGKNDFVRYTLNEIV
jgi:hypothetical protein